jgi:predicted Rdx family selenoprotein
MSAEAPNVAITYCRLCGWLLRASWMAQELLTTFAEELGSVTLVPDDTGGVSRSASTAGFSGRARSMVAFPTSKN